MRGRTETQGRDMPPQYSFASTGDFGLTPKWNEMSLFTSVPSTEDQRSKNFAAIGTTTLSISAIAVRKSNCEALLLGAASDFSEHQPFFQTSFPRAFVLYDAHADSHSFPDANDHRVATTRISLQNESLDVGSPGVVTFQLSFFAPPSSPLTWHWDP